MSNLKSCSKCGQQVDEQTKFCPQCGSSEFICAGNDPEKCQPDTSKKKGLQWWHILLMVVGVLVVVLLAVLVAFSVKGNKDDSSNNAKDDKAVVADADVDKEDDKELSSDPTPEKPAETTTKREEPTKGAVAYTKGTVSGNVYTNEWADLQFVIPDGYNEFTSYYGDAENDGVEYGLAFETDDGNVDLEVEFAEIPTDMGYDEDSYLEAWVSELLSDLYDDEDANVETSTATIAGNTFTKIVEEEDDGIGGIECVVLYVRAYDGHMIYIYSEGSSETEIDAIVSMFTPVE